MSYEEFKARVEAAGRLQQRSNKDGTITLRFNHPRYGWCSMSMDVGVDQRKILAEKQKIASMLRRGATDARYN